MLLLRTATLIFLTEEKGKNDCFRFSLKQWKHGNFKCDIFLIEIIEQLNKTHCKCSEVNDFGYLTCYKFLLEDRKLCQPKKLKPNSTVFRNLEYSKVLPTAIAYELIHGRLYLLSEKSFEATGTVFATKDFRDSLGGIWIVGRGPRWV